VATLKVAGKTAYNHFARNYLNLEIMPDKCSQSGQRASLKFCHQPFGNMMATTPSRIALFIDGANLHSTARTLGFDVDYKRLHKEFQARGELLRAFYYTAVVEDQEFSSIRPWSTGSTTMASRS
jgi:hypothetical protein